MTIHQWLVNTAARHACIPQLVAALPSLRMHALQHGQRVQIANLVSNAKLNGAIGVVLGGSLDWVSGRYSVRVVQPVEAAAAHKDGVRIKMDNLVLV